MAGRNEMVGGGGVGGGRGRTQNDAPRRFKGGKSAPRSEARTPGPGRVRVLFIPERVILRAASCQRMEESGLTRGLREDIVWRVCR